MNNVVIIGSGAAGLLLLLSLEKAGIQPERITVIDPHFDCGDLMRKWSCVRSNTVWHQTLQAVPTDKPLPEPLASLDPEQPCELRYIVQYLLFLTKPFLNRCTIKTGIAQKAIQDEAGIWNVWIKGSTKAITASHLIVATGSEPKSMDLPFPSIPLHVALDATKLSEYVKPNEHVLLFGTAHSSTIIIQNLITNGVKRITNFYATPKPFYFARDGDYDGIKQDAAVIADKILANEMPQVELVSIHDTAGMIRKTREADKVIYAIGFEQRDSLKINENTGRIEYDGDTGRLRGVTNAWGFGIAYPNRAEDKQHWDVSVPSFAAHIQKQLPDILSSLRIE